MSGVVQKRSYRESVAQPKAPRLPTFCIKHLARLAKASQEEKIGEND